MRTILAAAAAGALIMGSAAGAMALPAKNVKSPVQLQSVSIKGHSPVNVFNDTSARVLTVAATVRYAKAVPATTVEYPVVKTTLAAYKKKVNGDLVALPTTVPWGNPAVPTAVTSPIGDNLDFTSKTKKDLRFRTHDFKLDATQAAALRQVLSDPANPKVYLCIATVTVAPAAEGDDTLLETNSTQVKKRLNLELKKNQKPVRDCVKVVSFDPTAPTPK